MLNAINPAIGGILIRGEKGTAKSTAVRGLADLLPEIEVNHGCRFSCDPKQPDDFCEDCRKKGHNLETVHRRVKLINLPLGATEDRVIGGIDFSRAIQTGKTMLQPGLLAEAHRSMLYVDEVNLLDDHIVDLILDAAGSGRNVVEREGISCSHLAKLIIIGTMNPEEGELRPQLLDRFGFCVEVKGSLELGERIELLLRRDSFDLDQQAFTSRYSDESERIRKQIAGARKRLAGVRFAPHMRSFISELCTSNNVAGHRADLVLEQGALALAALEGDKQVKNSHIARISPMVLIHRTRDAEPPQDPPPPQEDEEPDEPGDQELEQDQEELQQDNNPDHKHEEQQEEQEQPQPDEDDGGEQQGREEEQKEENLNNDGDPADGHDQIFDIGESFKVKKITSNKDRIARRGSGRRSRSRISQKQGRYVKSALTGGGVKGDIAIDATIRAAAPFQKRRREKSNGSGLAVHLKPSDIRLKVREKRIGNLLLFVVDGSGSMGARGRMTASKSAIMSLLLDAYQKRDKVAMITFRRNEAMVNLPVTGSVELAGRLLAEMPVGGRTPLSAGLVKSYELIRNYLIREPAGRPIIIILTDGKTNVSIGDARPVDEMVKLAATMALEERAKYIVVDTEEEGLVTFDLARKLAAILGGEYFKTGDLQAEELVSIVREQQ